MTNADRVHMVSIQLMGLCRDYREKYSLYSRRASNTDYLDQLARDFLSEVSRTLKQMRADIEQNLGGNGEQATTT